MGKLTNITYHKNGTCYGLSLETYDVKAFGKGFLITGTFRKRWEDSPVEECVVEADDIDKVETVEYICETGSKFSAYIKEKEGYGLSPYGGWHIGDAPDGKSYYFRQRTVRDGHNGDDLVVSYEKEEM